MELCIGLFGTCGNSRWRDSFIERYNREGITFFNPQVDDWKPEDAEIEAKHLADDAVVLFPITGETTGMGSLSEVGFSVLNAIKLDDRRDFVVMIDKELTPELTDSIPPREAKDSIRARALVSRHLEKLRLSNLYVVSSLEEMADVSIALYRAAEVRVPLQKYNPHRKEE